MKLLFLLFWNHIFWLLFVDCSLFQCENTGSKILKNKIVETEILKFHLRKITVTITLTIWMSSEVCQVIWFLKVQFLYILCSKFKSLIIGSFKWRSSLRLILFKIQFWYVCWNKIIFSSIHFFDKYNQKFA